MTDTSDVLKELRKTASAFTEQASAVILPILARSAEIMYRNGWWVLGTLTTRQYDAICKAGPTPAGLTRLLLNHFNSSNCQRLAAVVQAWSAPAFVARREILGECMWAHVNEKYSLSTTVAVLQLEGVIRETALAVGERPGKSFAFVRGALSKRFNQLEKLPPGKPLSVDNIRALENYYNLRVLEKLYSPSDVEDDREPSILNRHSLAHGRATRFGTVENSTRAILLLDAVESLLRQLRPGTRQA